MLDKKRDKIFISIYGILLLYIYCGDILFIVKMYCHAKVFSMVLLLIYELMFHKLYAAGITHLIAIIKQLRKIWLRSPRVCGKTVRKMLV